jgi:hypothetical protein
MLVALAALGLLAVMLTGSVQFGARAWEGQGRRVDANAETDAVYTVMRTMLRNAQTMPVGGLGQESAAVYLAGRPNSLNFVSELPEAIGRGGFYDMALLVSTDGRLLLRWRPHMRLASGALPPPYEETELLPRVAALEIAYFVPAAENRPGVWQSSWTQPSALPALIRLRLHFEAGDRRVWRELRVAPIIGARLG